MRFNVLEGEFRGILVDFKSFIQIGIQYRI